MILKEEDVGGREWVTTDEERVARRVLTEINVKKLVSLKHGVRAINQT